MPGGSFQRTRVGPDPDPQWPGSTPPSAFTFSPLLAEIRQYLPKIATSSKGLRERPACRAHPTATACLYRAIPASGWETTSKHGCSTEKRRQLPTCSSVPNSSGRPKANRATQSLEPPLVYKSVGFNCILCFHRVSSYVPEKAQAA